MDDEFRQQVIEKLRRGEDLPPEWERELFPPERREYELAYHGKEREEEILAGTMAVPLQPVATFGSDGNDWHNMLVFGDNLQVLGSLLKMKEEGGLRNADGTPGVRLIYIDPPFATRKEFLGSQDQKAYQDRVAGAEFLEFLRKRLVLMRQLLSDDGTLVIHMDMRKGHYCKCLMDELFGEQNFRNELVWKRTGARSDSKTFNHIHDALYLYTRGPRWVWNVQHTPYSKDYIEKFFRETDEDRRRYRRTILTAPGVRRGSSGKPWRGVDPTSIGRHWAIPGYVRNLLSDPHMPDVQAALDELDGIGRILWPKKANGVPSFKQYLDEMEGVEIQSVWTDIRPVAANAREATGYPTQKPEALLGRIVASSSNPGDLVLDVFAGSGTTCAVAEKLGRRWIGVDCGKLAIYTMQKRLLTLRRGIGNKGRQLKPKPFTFYNAGLYDFSTLSALPWEDWKFFALRLFGCREEAHQIGGIHLQGKLRGASVLVFNHHENEGKRIDEETIRDIHAAVGNKIGRRFFVIAPRAVFDFQQDYIDLDGVRYYALRIPYSFINELHRRDFTALLQPGDEADVNNVVEAWGFDFIRPPKVDWTVGIGKPKGELIESAFLHVKRFSTYAGLTGEGSNSGLESLSMLMLDYDFNGEVFDLDSVFFGHQLEETGWRAWFPAEELGDSVMAVFIDSHGNEAREMIPRSKFRRVSRSRSRTKAKSRRKP